jgi:hypothetical protein
MAKSWVVVLDSTEAAGMVPEAHLTEFKGLVTAADGVLLHAMSAERNKIITAECKRIFKALTAKMAFLKRRYFFIPPFTEAMFAAMGLAVGDGTRTDIPAPKSQAEADITRPGPHLLELRIRLVPGLPPDPYQDDYGYRIYHGVMPPGGASAEAAKGKRKELTKLPINGDDLPFSFFTNRRRERFDYPAEDSGKTAYFCIIEENSKGDKGSWGPVFSAVIP